MGDPTWLELLKKRSSTTAWECGTQRRVWGDTSFSRAPTYPPVETVPNSWDGTAVTRRPAGPCGSRRRVH